MAKITFINKTDKTQVFQKHSYGFMTIKPGETVDLYLDYTKDITTKAFIKSFYSPYESIFDITYSFDEDVSKSYLEFSSDEDFTLSVQSYRLPPGQVSWDGTIEYSIDNGVTWNTWDSSELSGTASQPIYLRGTGNTRITGVSTHLIFTGKYCTGNIENLLDYQTVENGEHPVMDTYCYSEMFADCTSLITVPELPANTLSEFCYYKMFSGCTSLVQVPKLSATVLAKRCYEMMFMYCTSLITLPKLFATELPYGCYSEMFEECSAIKISETQTEECPYEYRIPIEGEGTAGEMVTDVMFYHTGGTFKGTPEINTTYYTNHEPV